MNRLLSMLAFVAAFAHDLADFGELVVEMSVAQAQSISNAHIDRSVSRSHNIVGAAVTLGLSVIMLILMAIVAGYFVSEAPSNGAFSDAINQVEQVGGTAFILLAVALLAVPVVAIVGYFMRSGLGGFITGGGMR
ncbi:hypothetical protein [Haloarcula rubripromontorii]|uniref:hypothetical protein n=1 Tax=Haloarcula rubripromontorii TaxID=1705562 RepID=UPI00345C3A5E